MPANPGSGSKVWEGPDVTQYDLALRIADRVQGKRPFSSPLGTDPESATEQLSLLLGGTDLTKTKPKRWYRKAPGATNLIFYGHPVISTQTGRREKVCWSDAYPLFASA